ncbi:hypothetical protein [Streptomyces longispororuber]|uniref:hypothetical protein n=1 Tax=Streptomyces longispororuber TaxID=68230 RepID=UPI00210C7AE5|nr:hypothetical protein [Streptomyces longispororuber]MCQ4211289.1 hypothetical protein [Streptomyces longispororuber]
MTSWATVPRDVAQISADAQAADGDLALAWRLPDLDDGIAGSELPAAPAEPLREAPAA